MGNGHHLDTVGEFARFSAPPSGDQHMCLSTRRMDPAAGASSAWTNSECRIRRQYLTYIPMARGFVYLAAVVDWFSRRVLAWRLSITLEVAFCLEAVEDALARHGRPEIFNTDQGSQFTSAAFTGLLLDDAIAISMDGRGSWRDNVFVERLWRSVKYEEVYLRALRQCRRCPCFARPVPGFLQSHAATFEPRCPNAGSRLLR